MKKVHFFMFFKISLRLCYIQPDHEKQNKWCVFMSTKVKNKKDNWLQASNCSKIRFEGSAGDKCKKK